MAILAAGLSTGCTTSRLNTVMSSVSAEPSLSLAGEDYAALPDTMAIVPTAFAGGTPSAASYEVASLGEPSEIYPLTVETEANASAAARPASFPPPPKSSLPVEEVSFVKPDAPRTEVDRLIEKYAALYEVPVALVRRVVKRESNFRPGARNGPYWGLMQILPATARGMGHRGTPRELLDAETNLKYAVKYLRGAYLVADGNHDLAVRYYSRGYYYDAKRRGMLDETGLGRDRRRGRA